MRITFLGTGTSYGVPHIGCDCAVCTSRDARNKRLRSSILVDTTPDLRAQLLRSGTRRLDAVLWTHWHNDHVVGLDDLRPLSDAQGRIPGFCSARTLESLKKSFDYVFAERRDVAKLPGVDVPRIDIEAIAAGQPLDIGALRVTPLQIQHGRNAIFAYRFEPRVLAQKSERNESDKKPFGKSDASTRGPIFVYATDCSAVSETSRENMCGSNLLVLGALRHREHPAHFSVSQAVAESQQLQARRTLFTHIAHDLDHDETNAQLPAGISLAHDEMNIDLWRNFQM